MRRFRPLITLAAASLLPFGITPIPAQAQNSAPLQGFLSRQLDQLQRTTVLVHGTDLAAADAAVEATGLQRLSSYDRIGVVVAEGTRSQILATRTQPGVTYLEGNQPITVSTQTSHLATRGAEAADTRTGANGLALDGSGVSVAVIDSGV